MDQNSAIVELGSVAKQTEISTQTLLHNTSAYRAKDRSTMIFLSTDFTKIALSYMTVS
jgi:hypothetical protein